MSSAEAHEVLDDTNRPLANFTPSIWGDYFISYASNSMEMDDPRVVETIMELKNKVKKIFDTDVVENSRKMLGLVDAVQRLGVSCHFEKEIEATLEKIHNNITLDHEHCDDYNNDLYTVSLCFRLLRQQGYNVSCDMFMKFKASEGKFRESLAEDIQGMLSLYEASHLRGHGEEVLDEAFIFTTTHLKSLPSSLSPPELWEQVNHSLKHPIRKSIQRREARRYLSVYEQDDSHDEALLSLAKLDFNQLQQLYKKELSELTRWWREFHHSREKLLGFSRDRIVECFYWSLGVFPEAKYSLIRIIYAKQIAVASIVDDIYDSFGTLDELELFTEAFERWDISSIHKLPDYMKLIYKAILDSNDEVEEKLGKGRPSYCFKEACLKLFRAYFQEAKWMHKKEIPTMDEFLPNACNSSASFPLIVLALLGMDDVVTKDTLDWVLTDPKIVRAFSVFLRFKNDIGHHKIEQRRSGNTVPTTVECYMKQYGTTEEEAIYELTKKFHELWKDVNEECLKPSIPRPLILRVLELVRLVDDIYTDGDAFTKDDLLKDRINSLIINPVPV